MQHKEPEPSPPRRVLIINNSPDVVEAMQALFAIHGFVAAGHALPTVEPEAVNKTVFAVREFAPDVIIFDLVPPYDRDWAVLTQLRRASVDGIEWITSSSVPEQAAAVTDGEPVYDGLTMFALASELKQRKR